MVQYFIFKSKNEYLPFIIKESIRNSTIRKDLIVMDAYYIDKKYLRKLKIRNIEDKNSDNDKLLLEYLINDSFVDMLSEEKYNASKRYSTSGYAGYQGTTGISCAGYQGATGVAGATGFSGPIGTTAVQGFTGVQGTASYPYIGIFSSN